MSNTVIKSGLRADIMRKEMETKNSLQKKGSIYVGTGSYDTYTGVDASGAATSESVYKTDALNIESSQEDGHFLVTDSSSTLGVTWSTSIPVGAIQTLNSNSIFASDISVTNSISASDINVSNNISASTFNDISLCNASSMGTDPSDWKVDDRIPTASAIIGIIEAGTAGVISVNSLNGSVQLQTTDSLINVATSSSDGTIYLSFNASQVHSWTE